MKRLGIVLVAICAANPKVDHHKMHPVATAEAVYSCPPGFVDNGSRCEKVIRQPLVPACTEGILQPDKTCLIKKPSRKECDQEFVLLNSVCTRTKTTTASLQCPHGYHFESQYKQGHGQGTMCVKTVVTPQYGCPSNARAEGDHCIVETSTPADLHCPEGTVSQGTACARLEEYDCNMQFTTSHTHHARKLAEENNSGPIRELNKKIRIDTSDMVIDVKPAPQPILNQVCQRTVLVPPEVICMDGHLVGRMCVTSMVSSKIETRPLMSYETAVPIASCPAGFAPCASTGRHHSSSDCCSTEEKAPFVYCDADYDLIGSVCQAEREADEVCTAPGSVRRGDGQECVSVQYADYTVKYSTEMQCQGRDCMTAILKHSHH